MWSAAVTAAATSEVAGLFAFRSVPALGYAISTRTIRPWGRATIAAASIGAYAALWKTSAFPIAAVVLAYVYVLAVTCGVPLLTRSLRAQRVTTGATFALCACFYFLLPLVFWPRSQSAAIFVIGWEAMLSAFSYCVDVARAGASPDLGDCVFFLMVNPSLVYSRKGQRVSTPGVELRGVLRIVLGLSTSAAIVVAALPLAQAARENLSQTPTSTWHGLVATSSFGVITFLVAYGRHSALASMQIGLMRQLGYRVSERYQWPALASSPLTFWRRWNTYLGQWLHRYIFWPLTVGVGRRVQCRRAQRARTGAAILVTFGACGILHDACAYGTGFRLESRMLELFIFNGAVVILSVVMGEVWQAEGPKRIGPTASRLVRNVLGRGWLLVVIVVSFYRWFQ